MAELITNPPKPNPVAVRLNISCKDCTFFSSVKLPDAASTCSGMGCPSNRAPCRAFTPNVLADVVGEAMASKAIRKALNSIPDASAGALAMAVSQMPRLRSAGLSLGQKVYFNAVGDSSGRDYVANYYSGLVMMIDRDGNVLVKGGKVTAKISVSSVITIDQWKEKRAKLLAKGRIVDPKSPFTWERKDSKLLSSKKYRPPWLDKEIAKYRTEFMDAKATRQTHSYDAAVPVKRGRGRPRKDGSPAKTKVKTHDVSATA